MITMLNFLLDRAAATLRDRRGVVSVEWIILTVVIMVAIVLAFAPQFQTMLTNAVTGIGTNLTTQMGAAGS